ncbi:Tyr recombinase domain-containing protein [Hyphomicrobium sp. 1Nfss2.1]|uniref:tyrosine-type recombinase/integrase n=1 Tax=Hyphomicrobium sp. 1Nfss2.1 TaxID=3413936 RepID=UPI003C7D1035
MAKALTYIAVERLQPTDSRREIPDARMPGLYLIIQPSGAKSWAVRYRHRGKPRKHTLGPFPLYDLSAARERANAALQAVDQGRDPAREKRKAKTAVKQGNTSDDTYPEIAKQFVVRYARPKNRSWKESARLLGLKPDPSHPDAFTSVRGGLAERWADMTVSEITKREIIGSLDEIVDRGSGSAANHTLAALRKFLNWCVDRDILMASPAQSVKPPTEAGSRDRVLSDDEIRLLWKAASGEPYPFGPLVKLLLLTGQRRTEVGGMTCKEIDVDGRLWSIPKERAKNDEPHEVPLSDAAIGIIDGLPRMVGSDFLFTTTGAAPFSGWSKSKRRIEKGMLRLTNGPISRWTLHDIRRTVASNMAALGTMPHVIEATLNHRSGTIKGVAAIYNRHRYLSEKREALEAWARRLSEIVAEPNVGAR